ncbi:MAG: aminopeptidase P family protein [Clostridiales bacterium]|nr:aminopeptidase P family protein [Clostridiales bacterium]
MKITELKQILSPEECFIVISPENRLYLTGFSSSDGYLLITKGKSLFLTDSRYIEAAQKQCCGCDEIKLLKDGFVQINEELRKAQVKSLLCEEEKLTVKEYNSLCEKLDIPVHYKKLDEAVLAMRRKKSVKEKDKILVSQRIAENAFEKILEYIKPGLTEKDVATQLDYYMLKEGAHATAFETICVSGPNSSLPHGVPGGRIIQNGDFITLDFGAEVDGYRSDMTRTVAVGFVNEKMKEVYRVVLAAQEAAIASYRPGQSCALADKAARDYIANAGYGEYFGHSTGHGVGIDIHESPFVSPKSKQTLAYGDIVTAEPGIYLPGLFGVRIEDMVYITEDGNENLTETSKDLIIL